MSNLNKFVTRIVARTFSRGDGRQHGVLLHRGSRRRRSTVRRRRDPGGPSEHIN
jgi:hypothetical protein